MSLTTGAFKLFARLKQYRRSKENAVRLQEQTLLSLINRASGTVFGKHYQFSSIKCVSEYQAAVPLRKYEDFWEEFWKAPFPVLNNITWPGTIPYFCLSSGTSSGTTKYIPYTNEMIASNSKAGLDLLIYHILNRPDSKLLEGKSFVLGGSTELNQLAPNIFGGDLSGIAAKTLPWWAKSFYFPPPELALLSDWEEKIEKLAAGALKEDIRSLNGIPSWILILLDKMSALSGRERSISTLFPNLELLTHGGVNFAPYYEQFKALLSGGKAELREVYPASEGFVAIADRAYGQGLRLNYNHDIFFEFVPLDQLGNSNPERFWLGNAEVNQEYAIVLTTAAGLWSYILGDTVRFLETYPPRLLVTGRTSYFLSAFGEHLAGEEVEKAVTEASAALNRNVSEYSLGAKYPEHGEKLGGHILIVEFTGEALTNEKLLLFQKIFIETLCRLNEDYAAHYSNGFGLLAPEIRQVSPGTFAAWMKSRGKLGGQNKVPRIISKDELFSDLLRFIEKPPTAG